MTLPTLEYEQTLWKNGISHVVGIDEVGRGALAGPVVAAAVSFSTKHIPIPGIRDSKTLSKRQKLSLEKLIIESAHSYGIGQASAQEIDELGIVATTALAMQRAIKQVKAVNHLLIDGRPFSDKKMFLEHQKTFIIKGDSLSYSIAAASILAKVYRDHLMTTLAKKYPSYCFESNVGYGTKKHRYAIKKYGLSSIHRVSFCSKL